MAPTIATSCAALPPEWAVCRGPCWREEKAWAQESPTLFTAYSPLPKFSSRGE
jgi:hypothetical protein